MAATTTQIFQSTHSVRHWPHLSSSFRFHLYARPGPLLRRPILIRLSTRRDSFVSAKLSQENDGILRYGDGGISLGTLKLPQNIDIPRFETLLFQWANSLYQGANLPLSAPLKVDKIIGGIRIGFITFEDGKTEVPVYIDCVVDPTTENFGPVFRAIRNGKLKERVPPDEPRIMRSLLQALQKSVEIARV